MKRSKIFLVTLITALAFTSGVFAKETFAMGANGGVVQPQEGKEDAGRDEKGHEVKKGEEGPSKEKSEEQQTDKSPAKKKPRLKYRDPLDCAC